MPATSLPIALELYTVRDETARDFAGTLRRVAEIGYTAVEFAGYGGFPAEEMAALLRETRLQAPATHVSLQALASDIEREIEYCRAIGCSYLVLPGLPGELRAADRLPALAEQLNGFGRRCRDAGMQFGYHNHDWEFAPMGSGAPEETEMPRYIDHFLAATDRELVELELDVYWAAYTGTDPADFLREHAGRTPILHLKDMTPDRRFTEVGDGVLGLAQLVKQAPELGVRWGIVENDAPQMPSLESARRSLENLVAMSHEQ